LFLQRFELLQKDDGTAITVLYTNVNWERGSVESVVLIIEITGVIPLPAAKAR
jgi:hypothetical protein